ncbi:hypothetical protein SLEP1_g29940 [Rubroshorea leprosula]|uniref:Uncharacterized protein n=1 Tax=Rubroshorea leprosula TaxID=152421 RepID=A0AAV5K5C7_9ROSI|nr:hypothetical protein SLEP1_g29940 [Rubroshorea leprosula]
MELEKRWNSSSFANGKGYNTMEIHATQPKKYDGKLAEMSAKYFSRDLLQITGLAIEIVSIGRFQIQVVVSGPLASVLEK